MKDKLFELIKSNLKNPKLYVVLIILIFIFILIFPYIDANFFYYNRVEKRIEILNEISQLDQASFENNPILKSEYDSILNEISKQKDGSIGSIFKTNVSETEKLWKFIFGGAISWILALVCIFVKFDKVRYKIAGIFLCVLLGIVLGIVFSLIPTIITPIINYSFSPVLQIVLLGLLTTNSNKRKNN